MLKKLKNGKPAVAYYLRFFRKYYQHHYLPAVKYLDVDEYIDIHKNVKKYIKYCEVLVNKQGKVALAVPSHSDAVYGGNVVTKAKYLYMCNPSEYCTEKLCDDFGVIMVWYEYTAMGWKLPSPEQVSTMYQLYITGCVSVGCWNSFVKTINYAAVNNNDRKRMEELSCG